MIAMHPSQNARRQGLVLGLGATGLSALGYLQRLGWRMRATDDRNDRASLAGKAWCSSDQAMSILDDTGLVVVSPGVPLNSKLVRAARERGIEILGDVELFARSVLAPVIAITGTNGKSTVTRMVEAMARAGGRVTAAGGNLGTPALDLLDASVELYVLELSSFQLELTESLSPRVATVLNISADHLDRHGSLEAYTRAKARVYERAQTGVFNRDDVVAGGLGHAGAERITFGLGVPPGDSDYGLRDGMLCRGEKALLGAAEVPLAGRHNLANVLAAWALAATVGVSDEDIARAVRAFKPLAHRLELVAEREGVRFYDDSKATNVSAACSSLEGLSGCLVVIAGGQAKGQDFAPFADLLAARARAVVLMGVDSPQIARALDGRVDVLNAASMDEAVAAAARLARPGDCVVLAPACASLDMFTDYAARGEAFVQAVEALDE
jgi:UDP-N-acetylmuramoylalanine--D-glutamate ligase